MNNYQESIDLLKSKVKSKNLHNHMYAVESICRSLARHFNENENEWAIAGLLHDIDYDTTAKKPKKHSIVGAKILKDLGYSENIVYAVMVHNGTHGYERKSLLDKVLYAADPLSGLIVASALIHPSKKLANIGPDSILRRYKEKGFAKGANREQIGSCVDFNMDIKEFITIGYNSMSEIADKLGL